MATRNETAGRVTFVDLGAFDGASTRLYERIRDVEFAYLWECHPDVAIKPPRCGHEVIRAAAWIDDGTTEFYQGERCGVVTQGSSLLKEKTTGWLDVDNPLTVETRDFSRWLAELPSEWPAVVKVNIEGAEYELLTYLYMATTIRLPHEWHVSFHSAKVGRTRADDDGIRTMLFSSGYSECPSPFPGCEGWKR